MYMIKKQGLNSDDMSTVISMLSKANKQQLEHILHDIYNRLKWEPLKPVASLPCSRKQIKSQGEQFKIDS